MPALTAALTPRFVREDPWLSTPKPWSTAGVSSGALTRGGCGGRASACSLLGAFCLGSRDGVGPASILPHVARVTVSRHHHRRPQDERADRKGRQVRPGQGRHPRHRQSRRHDHRRRGDVRRRAPPRREEAGGRRLRHARHLRRLYRRARHRPHLRLRQHHHRLGRRHLPMGEVTELLQHARHQGRGGARAAR